MPELIIDPDEVGLTYEPAPPLPPDFERKLKDICGLSPAGTPFLRYVWGMDATEVIGNYIVHRYPDPEGKSVGMPFWILEGWQSPDVYDETQWKANKELFGDWPQNGIWDFIRVLRDKDNKFIPLDNSMALDLARNWRHWSKQKTKERSLEDLMKRRCELQVLKEQRSKERKESLYAGFERDYANVDSGTFDPRRKRSVAKIDSKGEYRKIEENV